VINTWTKKEGRAWKREGSCKAGQMDVKERVDWIWWGGCGCRRGRSPTESGHMRHWLGQAQQERKSQLCSLEEVNSLMKSLLTFVYRAWVFMCRMNFWYAHISKTLKTIIFLSTFTGCSGNFIREDLDRKVRAITIKDYLIF
jgi:hypothetical protein